MAALPPLTHADEFAGDKSTSQHLVAGPFRYCHYGADGFNDSGWGCGYRTAQSMLSWLAPEHEPPSIPVMQSVLGQVPGGRDWIGVPDAVVLLDALFDATCEVLPLATGTALKDELPRLAAHFDAGGGPLMVGGGGDVYSKTVLGVRFGQGHPPELLIVDPHYEGRAAHDGDVAALRHGGFADWKPISILHSSSFYNLALPRPLPPGTSRRPRLPSLAAAAGAEPSEDWGIEVVGAG